MNRPKLEESGAYLKMRKRGENGKRESQSGYPRIIARLSQIRRAGKDGKERERSMKALEQRTFRGSDDDPFESKALSRKPLSRPEIYSSDGTGHAKRINDRE